MIALVRLRKAGEFAVVPVEFSAVNDNAAHLNSVTVHIFRCGMNNDIGAPFNGSAKIRCSKGIVNNKRNAVLVSGICPGLNVENGKGGIGDSLTENSLCVGLESSVKLFRGSIYIDPDAFDAHFFQSKAEKIDCSAVNGGRSDKAVTSLADVQDREQGSCLTA